MRLTVSFLRRSAQFVALLSGKTPKNSSLRTTPPKTVLLLSFPRSGTSWIGSVLDNFGPPFIDYGELFGGLSESPGLAIIARHYRGFRFRYLRIFISQRRDWKPLCFEGAGLDPTRVLEIVNQQPGINVIKVFPGHLADDQLATLLKNYVSQVVFLRRNHFDRLVSLKVAQQSGKWQNEKYFGPEISPDRDELKRFTDGYTSWYREKKSLCIEIGIPVLDVAYEDLFSEEKLHALVIALSGGQITIPENQTLVSSLSKQGPRETHVGHEFEEWMPESST